MPDDDQSSEPLDVLIVGAGFAGLSAARELHALGLRFAVLDVLFVIALSAAR